MAKSLPLSPAFLAALDGFLIKANGMIADDYAKHYPSLEPPVLCPDAKGLKYIRIVRHDSSGSRSSHCFIDKSNGDVLKCEGWKKPAKHARGNIFSASNGLEGIGVHGANYLR